MTIRMYTRSIVNFLCTETVEEHSAEYPDTNYVIDSIHLHTRMMKNLGYINIPVVKKLNKRTLQQPTCTETRSSKTQCKTCVGYDAF